METHQGTSVSKQSRDHEEYLKRVSSSPHGPPSLSQLSSLRERFNLLVSSYEEPTPDPITQTVPWGRLILVNSYANVPRCVELYGDTASIGRLDSNNLTLLDGAQTRFISKKHAKIEKVGSLVYLENFSIYDGTLLNGKRIKRSTINTGNFTTGKETLNQIDTRDYSESDRVPLLIQYLPRTIIYAYVRVEPSLSLNQARRRDKQPEEYETPKRKYGESSTNEPTESEPPQKLSKHVLTLEGKCICPVCNGPFEEPTQLECGHTFCRLCLHTRLAHDFECPVCRDIPILGSSRNLALEALMSKMNLKQKNPKKEPESHLKKVLIETTRLLGEVPQVTQVWRHNTIHLIDSILLTLYGKTRSLFLDEVGLSFDFLERIRGGHENQTIIETVCSNLGITPFYTVIDTRTHKPFDPNSNAKLDVRFMRRVIDSERSACRLIEFRQCGDNTLKI